MLLGYVLYGYRYRGLDWHFVFQAALDSNGKISKEHAIALASTNIEKLLGVTVEAEDTDFVASISGDFLDPSSRVASIISPRRGRVDLV